MPDTVTRWGWGRPEGKVYEVVVRPTCDGRGWYEPLCADGCCGSRYTKGELYETQEDATKAARLWVKARVTMYSTALAALDGTP